MLSIRLNKTERIAHVCQKNGRDYITGKFGSSRDLVKWARQLAATQPGSKVEEIIPFKPKVEYKERGFMEDDAIGMW